MTPSTFAIVRGGAELCLRGQAPIMTLGRTAGEDTEKGWLRPQRTRRSHVKSGLRALELS